MTFPRKIALRYLRSKRSEAFISILTFISAIALAIGVAVLVVVMSIMNGFEYELKNKLLGANAHISVRTVAGPLFQWKPAIEVSSSLPEVKSASPYTYNQGLLQSGRRSTGVLIRGIRENDAAGRELLSKVQPDARRGDGLFANIEGAASKEKDGDAHSPLPGIVIGKELAETMTLDLGDVITILSPQVQSSPFGLMPRFRRFQIVGIYASGLVEYENTLVYIDMEVAQSFFRLHNTVHGLEVLLHDLNKAPQVALKLSEKLREIAPSLYAEPWTETHKNLWEALHLERSAYFTVLLLLVIMASFSIVSTLVMLVLEKRKDIAVIRTLGATEREVGAIFRITGMTIGFIGTVSGLILGYLLCIALQTFGFPLPEKIFPVSTLPIRMDGMAFAVTGVCALVICYLATLYPVRRAARLRPSELLRYE